MSFQYMIDNAAEIQYSCRPIISQTVARSGMIRSVSRGNAVWRFIVTPPSGVRYSDYKRALVDMEAQDAAGVQDIQINNPGYDYLFGYQGDITTTSRNFRIPTSGNVIYDDNTTTGWRFKKGDLVQVYNQVYMVENDVIGSGTGEIQLNRPLLLSTGQGNETIACNIGDNSIFKVKCINVPTYAIRGYNQVFFNGDFVFQEVIDLD